MNASKTLGVCQPAAAILLISIAAVLYHLLAGNTVSIIWWIMTGVFGTGIFQALCSGGMEPIAWVLMSIPVLLVCFFLAIALFASSMRIDNVQAAGECRQSHCQCESEGFSGSRGNQCPYGRCECPYGGGTGLDVPYCPGAASLMIDPRREAFVSSCKCMGGSCNGACKKGQSLNCNGSGDPNCTYQNQVVSTTEKAAAMGYDVANPIF